MNYIKKKIKGTSSKKATPAEEDDDFDPNLFHVLQRPADGAPEGWVPYDDRVDEESDEWRAFRQLTQRVTDTLTETKENLSKIVATTALTETSHEWQIRKITATSEDPQSQPQPQPQQPINGAAATAKPDRPAPPRPPAPPAPASAQFEDSRFEAAFPAANFAAGDEFQVKRKPIPPRPPPSPLIHKAESELEFDLGAEFGFEPAKPVSNSTFKAPPAAAPSTGGSLFLDDNDNDDDNDVSSSTAGDDPFDTSFVTELESKSAAIRGLISDEELDSFGRRSEAEADADDPFIIKEDIIASADADSPVGSESDEEILEDKQTKMDPFESFLQSASGGVAAPNVQQRAKSPNPFLVDSDQDPVTTSTMNISSSNPFAAAAASASAMDDDDPFGTQLAPNPFASSMSDHRHATTGSGAGAKSANDIDDLFGFGDNDDDDRGTCSAATAMAASNEPPSNPFASFGQPTAEQQQQQQQQTFGAAVAPPSSFDPFGADDLFSTGSDIVTSSHRNVSAVGDAASIDPFGLGSRGMTTTTMTMMTMTNIPAAPSSQDLFRLNDDDDDNRSFFQPNVDKTPSIFDDAREKQSSSQLIDSAFDVEPAGSTDDAQADADDNQEVAPDIDFFNADAAVVNVSGVSVELSEVSPAKIDDDYDEFFVGSNGNSEAYGDGKNSEMSNEREEEEAKSQAKGPPPRPPPPTSSVAKPARPPPPKMAATAAPAAPSPATTTDSKSATSASDNASKTFDAFFSGEVHHKEREFDKSWDAFPPLVAGDDVTVDVAGAGLIHSELPDPFGLSSAEAHAANEERRKSGTYDTYERKASGPIDELLGCFETSVAPIVPAAARAACDLDLFGTGQPEVLERHVAFDMSMQPRSIGGGGGGGGMAQNLFASTEPVTPPQPLPPPPPPDDDDSLADTDPEASAIEAEYPDRDDAASAAAVPFGADSAAFDAFDAKFQSTSETTSSSTFDVFGATPATFDGSGFSSVITADDDNSEGFGAADDFDQYFALKEMPAAPKPSPARFPMTAASAAATATAATPEKVAVDLSTTGKMGVDSSSSDSDDNGPDFSVFIRPKMKDKDDTAGTLNLGPIPALAPPPKSPMRSPPSSSSQHTSPRFNPFDKEPGATTTMASTTDDARGFVDVDAFSAAFSTPVPDSAAAAVVAEISSRDRSGSTPPPPPPKIGTALSVDSQESPGSPLFDVDDTEPLDDFYPKRDAAQGWDLMLRQPSKKKLTGQRFWKKVYVTISDNGVLHLYNKSDDKDAFQELPLQACYSLTEIGAQQYDTYGKIFTVKLQYVFYRERVGVRPGQISKVTHGQVTSLGQLAKLGLPLEHSPQVSQLLKLGTQQYEDLRVFIREVEDSLFHLSVHRDRALTYKTEEVQVTVVDELRVEVHSSGVVLGQLARVRVFFLAFIVGMPDVELGLNDITKQGREVVGRHDIIPVVTEEWIRLEKCQFHSCVTVADFDKTRTIKFHPPDACFFEILRFRIRPPKNRELPLQVKATMSIIGNRVEIRADVLVPGCISRKHGQIPCEDVSIRFPLPECWIYLFRVEKHFRYGSLKSAARKPGKIKGLERIMGAGLTMEPSMIEVSTGQAKYEHQHRAIVWRVPRLPKDGQGAYTTQLFVCRMELTSYDQIPAELDHFVHVEFTMPATTVSHTTVRSVSVTNPNPPEKYVKYLARHKYRIEIEHVTATSECDYVAATTTGAAAASGGGGGGPASGASATRGQSISAQGHGSSDSFGGQ